MMAITSKILSIEVKENPEKMSYKVGETFDASGMKVVAKLANGLERDITNYVTWQEGPIEQGQTSITLSYTYGFDNANYGLKTVTAEIADYTVTSPTGEGYTITGENRDSRSRMGRRLVLRRQTATVYAGEVFEIAPYYGMDEDLLRRSFSLIQGTWNNS